MGCRRDDNLPDQVCLIIAIPDLGRLSAERCDPLRFCRGPHENFEYITALIRTGRLQLDSIQRDIQSIHFASIGDRNGPASIQEDFCVGKPINR